MVISSYERSINVVHMFDSEDGAQKLDPTAKCGTQSAKFKGLRNSSDRHLVEQTATRLHEPLTKDRNVAIKNTPLTDAAVVNRQNKSEIRPATNQL